MFLRDLAVSASPAARPPDAMSLRDFNFGTHTPVEAYLDRLPRRKVALGGVAKVSVLVGPRPDSDPPSCVRLGTAIVYWPWFDFARYAALSRAAQQARVVGVLHRSLLRFAARTGSDPRPFDAAFAGLLAESLPLPELTRDELFRRWGLTERRPPQAR